MKFLGLLFEIFVLYLLFKLVFDFIIPIYRASRKMKERMKETTQNMETPHPKHTKTSRTEEGEYIDFEEIK